MRIEPSKLLEGKELEELQERRIKYCKDLIRKFLEVEKFMKSDKYKSTLIFK